MIGFERPEVLFFLALIPLIVVLHLLSLVVSKKKFFKFANYETMMRMHDDKSIVDRNIPQLVLRLVFLLVLILAGSGPMVTYNVTGVADDIIFAIDNSGSMLAKDLYPNRLEATKKALNDYIQPMASDIKFGVIKFTSLSFLEQPLTYDKASVLSAIKRINVKQTSGTSIGNAINFAIGHFDHTDPEKTKKIIIITDGQENVLKDQDLVDVIEHAGEYNIQINILGVGTELGGSINNKTLGASVVNTELLEELSNVHNGSFANAQTELDLKQNLDIFLSEGPLERDFDLTLILYIVGFVVLLIEWYFLNHTWRVFPN